MDPLLLLSVILIAGVGGGWVARRCHMPSTTGYLVVGVILGQVGHGFFQGLDAAKGLQPLSTFAMGLIAVSVGGHLSYRRIHNALRRILAIALSEVACCVVAVTVAVRLFGVDWFTAFLLGAIAVETAPATTVALISEMRAKGTFVKTLMSVVALDNILCLLLFSFAARFVVNFSQGGAAASPVVAVLDAACRLGGSIVLGLALGKAIEHVVHIHRFHNFSTVFLGVLLSTGLPSYLHFSPLLTSLCLGVYLANSSQIAEEQLKALEPIEPMLYVCFFTLAGISLHIGSLVTAGWLCAAFLFARVLGKGVGGVVGGALSGATARIWANLPAALIPQAGVSVGLIVLLEGDPAFPETVAELAGVVVLAAVAVDEIIGPFFTRWALRRSNEVGMDRRRLMEFLQEEHIMIGLGAADKWLALRQLTDFFLRTHHMDPKDSQALYATIVEREQSMTTAIGMGAAIPHGRIEKGPGIQGVLAVCPDGVDFDALDGQPVRLIMLIVTPKDHEQQHLEVLASLAAMVSDDLICTRLLAATDANQAWEIIAGEETHSYNYFLED